MNILITGGAGFIGTHLTRRLLDQGHSITILDNFLAQVHGKNRQLPSDLRSSVHLIEGDVTDPSRLSQALNRVECIVHLAAETGTGQSMYQVSRYARTNVEGIAQIYDQLIKSRSEVRGIVCASSRAIYGEGAYLCDDHGTVYPESRTSAEKYLGQYDPLCPKCGGTCIPVATPEDAPPQPSSFYGLTKLTQEQTALLFGQVLQIPTVALRYQNVFGPGQSLQNPYTGILAVFSNLARVGRPIQVFEDGLESRDFVYIGDVVDATSACVNLQASGCHLVNVGSGKRTTVLEVAKQINSFYGSRSEINISGAFREGDIRHGLADLSRVQKLLSYEPQWKFADGLYQFLSWANETAPSDSGYEQSLLEMKERGLLRG